MDLVDEEDRVLFLGQPVEHLLHALFEIAAIPRARDERAQIEREDARPVQHVRDVALVDAEREAFGERRLPHSGFTHQERVVLAAPAKHLNHALDLERPAYERIDLPRRRSRHQVGGIGLQRVRRGRALLSTGRGGRGFTLRAVRQDTQQEQPLDTLRTQEIRSMTVFLLEQEDQQAATLDVLGARRDGVHHRLLHDAFESERRFGLDDCRGHDRGEGLREHVRKLAAKHFEVRAARGQHAPRLRFVGDREKQVLEPDFFMTTIGRETKGPLNRFVRLRGKRHRCLTHVLVPARAPWSRAAGIPALRPSAWSS